MKRIIWESKDLSMFRSEFTSLVDLFEFNKWTYLIETEEIAEKISSRVKERNTTLKCERKEKGIVIKFQCTTVKDEKAFEKWKSECERSAKETLSDILILSVQCELEDAAEIIRNALTKRALSTVKVIDQKYSHRVFLFGDGESLSTIIPEICRMKHFEDAPILDQETQQEIETVLITLNSFQIHCWKHLDIEKRLREKFYSVKTYGGADGKSLKLIGNKDAVREEEHFVTTNEWLNLYNQETRAFDEDVLEFLDREAVKKFINSVILEKGVGIWILSVEKKSVIAYGIDDKNAQEVLETLCQSFHCKKFQIASKWMEKRKDFELWKKAKQYEKRTNGMFCMHIGPSLKMGETEISFLFTSNLQNDELGFISLMDEMQQELKSMAFVEEKIVLKPKKFCIMKEMKKRKLLELRHDVNIEFGEENTLILNGEAVSVSDQKAKIDSLMLGSRSVIFPLSLHHTAEDVCLEHHCVLHTLQFKPQSQGWCLKNSNIVLVYQGEPRKDLSIDSRADWKVSDGDKKGKMNE